MRGNKRKKTTRQLNNKGFSMIELIVVIAIMALLVGVAGFGRHKEGEQDYFR